MDVLVYAGLGDATIRATHLVPCRDITVLIQERVAANPAAQIADLPQGPRTIPYIG